MCITEVYCYSCGCHEDRGSRADAGCDGKCKTAPYTYIDISEACYIHGSLAADDAMERGVANAGAKNSRAEEPKKDEGKK